jgi:PAS domain S-box-containing protein
VTPSPGDWSSLFASAFAQSRNAMLLADDQRLVIDVNRALLSLLGGRRADFVGRRLWELVDGGPLMTGEEWARTLAQGRFTGATELRRVDGGLVGVQWGASTELVTGRRLVLFVALGTARWGRRFRRREADDDEPDRELTGREREIVALLALGSTGSEIADELHISHETVRTHVRNAMEKVHARSRAHLVAKALTDGLVPA